MAKTWLEQMRGLLGVVGGCIGIGSAIASVSVTTISTALFWAAIGFTVIIAFAFLIGLLVVARDPEVPTAEAVKRGLDGFVALLFGASLLYRLGYEDPSEFGVTQAIGAVMLIASVATLVWLQYERWKATHKKCPECDTVHVVQARRCKECDYRFPAAPPAEDPTG